MSRFLTLAEAVESPVRDVATEVMVRITSLNSFCAGTEGTPPARQTLHTDQLNAGSDLRPARRHGICRKPRLLLGRKPRRWLPAPVPLRLGERLFGAAPDLGAFPRRHGQRLRGRRRRTAV